MELRIIVFSPGYYIYIIYIYYTFIYLSLCIIQVYNNEETSIETKFVSLYSVLSVKDSDQRILDKLS